MRGEGAWLRVRRTCALYRRRDGHASGGCKPYGFQTGRETLLDYGRIFGIIRSMHYNGWNSLVYGVQEDDRAAIEKGVRFLPTNIL